MREKCLQIDVKLPGFWTVAHLADKLDWISCCCLVTIELYPIAQNGHFLVMLLLRIQQGQIQEQQIFTT